MYFWDDNQVRLKKVFEYATAHYCPHLNLIPMKFDYQSKSSNFGTLDFRQLMLEKVVKMKEIIKSRIGTNSEILISDIDIIAYDNFEDALVLGDKDILLQKENQFNGINTGFIYLKCSEKTYRFYEAIEQGMRAYPEDQFINEQAIVNHIIHNSDIQHSLFNDDIWAKSNPIMPEKIKVHHANCTIPQPNKSSYELKIEQFLEVLNMRENEIKDGIIAILTGQA